MHQNPSILPKIEGFIIFSEPTSNGLTVRNSFYATFMGLYGLIRPILQNQRPTVFYICALILWVKTQHFRSVFADFPLFLCVFKTSFCSISKFLCFLSSIFTLKIPTFFSKSILEHIRKWYMALPFSWNLFSYKNLFSFDVKHVFLKLNQELSYLINIEVHHKMNYGTTLQWAGHCRRMNVPNF